MDACMIDPAKHIALADRYWKDEVQGSNSFVQRGRRLVFKVPHYQSGDDLARAVTEARSKGLLR